MAQHFGLDLMNNVIKVPKYVNTHKIEELIEVDERDYSETEKIALKYFRSKPITTAGELLNVRPTFITSFTFGLLVPPSSQHFNTINNNRMLLWHAIRTRQTDQMDTIRKRTDVKVKEFITSIRKENRILYLMDLQKFVKFWHIRINRSDAENRSEFDLLTKYMFSAMNVDCKHNIHSIVAGYFATKRAFLEQIIFKQHAM